MYIFAHSDLAMAQHRWNITDTDWQPCTKLGDWFEEEQKLLNNFVLEYFTNKFIPHEKGSPANDEERYFFKEYLQGEPIDIDDLGTDTLTKDTAEKLKTQCRDLLDYAFVALCFPYGNPPKKTFEEERQQFPLCAQDAYRCFTEKWTREYPGRLNVPIQIKECLSLLDAKRELKAFFQGPGQRAKTVKVVTIGHGGPGGLFRIRNEGQAIPSRQITATVEEVAKLTEFPLLVDVVFCQCHAWDQLQCSINPDRIQVHALATPEKPRVPIVGRYRVYACTDIPVQDASGNRQFVSGEIPRLREYLLDFEAEDTNSEMQVDSA